MKINYKHVIPTFAAVVLTASAAMAQMPAAGQQQRGANRTPLTTEQMAERQAQMCADRSARAAAQFTYLEERLKLTAAQKPLFDRWKTAVQSDRAAAQADCTKPRPAPTANAQRLTLPERNARMEDALKARLASLQKTRPAQEALYNALTAEQKQVLDQRGGRAGAGQRMGNRDGRGPGMGGFGMGRSGMMGGSGMGRPGMMGGPGMGGPGGNGPRGGI